MLKGAYSCGYLLRPQATLKGEGGCDNTNSENAQSPCSCRHYRSGPATRAAPHACLHKLTHRQTGQQPDFQQKRPGMPVDSPEAIQIYISKCTTGMIDWKK